MNNGVIVPEEIDLLDVGQGLDTYAGQSGKYLPNFLMADLSFLSSVT